MEPLQRVITTFYVADQRRGAESYRPVPILRSVAQI